MGRFQIACMEAEAIAACLGPAHPPPLRACRAMLVTCSRSMRRPRSSTTQPFLRTDMRTETSLFPPEAGSFNTTHPLQAI
eukprot:363369-Chlamydomonas_euryale.AAC.4